MDKYRIAWKAGLTDATGHGTALFSYDEAKLYCDEMNKQLENKALKIFHYPELVMDEKEKEDE